MMELRPEEPDFSPWDIVETAVLAERLLARPATGSRVIAIDGRGGSGKSTLAAALADVIPGAVVLHTDDVAWHEPFFEWGHIVRDRILLPLSRGESVDLRPDAWVRMGRKGAITVPAGASVVLLEGTGAHHAAYADLLAATVWVQSDWAEAERRGIERDVSSGANGDREEATRFWHEWMAHEVPFLAEQRPWEHAVAVACGTPLAALPVGTVLMSDLRRGADAAAGSGR